RTRIPLYMAAVGKNSTRVAARLCDGLITFLKGEGLAVQLASYGDTLREQGRDRDSVDVISEYKLSYDEDYDRAFESVKRWKPTRLEGVLMSEIHDPRELERRAEEEVSDETMKESWDIVTSIDDAIGSIEKQFSAGFTRVYVHSSSPDENKFIRDFTSRVLPHFEPERRVSR
ncbi:MAG: LLM class flavin-dependent oxidoreductase, partial [Thaumarchaeota archaeon]|nr:LLM class flavin-dependent oxidoreductase [Nitrososphaerota archaeon]